MKKPIFTIIMLVVFSTLSLAQIEAELVLEKEVINVGKLNFNDSLTIELNYKNIGGKPLIITQVKVQCSCTRVEFSKMPLLKGKQASFNINLVANTKGRFIKELYIYSNSYPSPLVISLKGIVK